MARYEVKRRQEPEMRMALTFRGNEIWYPGYRRQAVSFGQEDVSFPLCDHDCDPVPFDGHQLHYADGTVGPVVQFKNVSETLPFIVKGRYGRADNLVWKAEHVLPTGMLLALVGIAAAFGVGLGIGAGWF